MNCQQKTDMDEGIAAWSPININSSKTLSKNKNDNIDYQSHSPKQKSSMPAICHYIAF
jgi:hypothetical protein